jgi:hypothetical protein
MNNFETICEQDLDAVSGGKHENTTHDMNNMGGGNNNDQLMTMLQSIQSSIKDLGKNSNNGLFGGNNMMLFMTMAMAMRRNEVVVYNNRGNGGYYWRSW